MPQVIKIRVKKKRAPDVWIPARKMRRKYKYLSRWGTPIRKRQLFDDGIQIKFWSQYGGDGIMTLPLDYMVIRYSEPMQSKLKKEYEERKAIPVPSTNGHEKKKVRIVVIPRRKHDKKPKPKRKRKR